MGWSLADLSAFMEKQQHMMKEERELMEAKVERTEAKLEQQREEMEQARPQVVRDTISEEQLGALQLRLEALHEARLLTDGELNRLEDDVVDCIEVLPTAFVADRSIDKVIKMILVSEGGANDKTLARQLKRKFA